MALLNKSRFVLLFDHSSLHMWSIIQVTEDSVNEQCYEMRILVQSRSLISRSLSMYLKAKLTVAHNLIASMNIASHFILVSVKRSPSKVAVVYHSLTSVILAEFCCLFSQ